MYIENILQREDIPPVDKDVVFLAQDWQAAASDIEVVKEMAWLMYSYVTFFNNHCLNVQSNC